MEQKQETQKQETLEEWLISQIARGCSLESMISSMQVAGYSANSARDMVVKAFTDAGKLPNHSLQAQSAWQKIAPKRQVLHLIKPIISLDSPRIMVFDDFLSDIECDTLVQLSKAKMEDSTVIDPITGHFVKHPERTSLGTHFEHQSSDVVIAIENRITEIFGFDTKQQEAIQILQYALGGEYKAHFDFFSPSDASSHALIAEGGQRLATLIMYLNTPVQGGSTDLPNLGLSIRAKKGSALYFENINQQGEVDERTLHAGMPVIAGEKWIATKWLRENDLF
jgi:prolyl 4-hydroxylase